MRKWVSKFVGEGFHALPFPICVVGDADRHRDLSLRPYQFTISHWYANPKFIIILYQKGEAYE